MFMLVKNDPIFLQLFISCMAVLSQASAYDWDEFISRLNALSENDRKAAIFVVRGYTTVVLGREVEATLESGEQVLSEVPEKQLVVEGLLRDLSSSADWRELEEYYQLEFQNSGLLNGLISKSEFASVAKANEQKIRAIIKINPKRSNTCCRMKANQELGYEIGKYIMRITQQPDEYFS